MGFFGVINDLTWGWALVPFLVILGLLFTIASGFVQFRFFFRMFRIFSPAEPVQLTAGGITPLQALFVSVGGRVGGGNIAGVAVAITLGGPGAVFWMWAIAVVGMATSLLECSLAQLYKRKDSKGDYRGGPARYIIYGLGNDYRWLAVVYAVCLILVFGVSFPAFQGNTVAGAALDSFGLERVFSGVIFSVLTGIVIYGGMKRIASVSEKLVPVMALGYIGLSLFIILLNLSEVPAVLYSIFANAFGYQEVVGGGMGAAIVNGVSRGLFSNEAGLGSAPNVAAAASVQHPVAQGIVQSLSVFIDTIVICTCTALVILLSEIYSPGMEGVDGIALTQQSIIAHIGEWGRYFLLIAIVLFSFSSIIYNYYLGENALTVFTQSEVSTHILRFIVIGGVFLGAIAPGATAVFFFSDPLMGVLAIVNLVAITMLFPVGKRILDDYRSQLKKGIKTPIFDPKKHPDLKVDHSVWS